MNFFNKPDKNFFKEFFFIQDQNSQVLNFTGNSLQLEFPVLEVINPKNLTVPLNKPIKNNFNYFYAEIQNISKEFFAFGFSESVIQPTHVIGQSMSTTNFAIEYKNNKLIFFIDKQGKFEKTLSDPQRIGIGIHALTAKIFITVDGICVKELKCPKVGTDNGSFTGYITLRQKSHIRVHLEDLLFDIDSYIQQKYNAILDDAERNKKIKPKDIEFLVKSYLNQNGFKDTLNSLDETFRENQIKQQRSLQQINFLDDIELEDDKQQQADLSVDMKDQIRFKVIQQKNWEFLLQNVILEEELKNQIKFLNFLEKFYKCKTELEKIQLFQHYNNFFKENQTLQIYQSDLNVEKVITDLLINKDINQYKKFINNEYKNNILGKVFKSSNNNELSKVLAHLQVLTEFQSKFYGFQKSFDYSNSKIQQNN